MELQNEQPKRVLARAAEMKWLAENRAYLEKTFPGKWLALDGARLVAVGDGIPEVREKARREDVLNPFFSAVRSRKYQGVMLFRGWR